MTENNNNQIFREKSLERVSSPEKLDEYLKVTPIKVWMILGTIIVVLIGVIVWCYFGRLETKVYGACKADGSTCKCYITESDISKINSQYEIEIDGKQYALGSISNIGIKGEGNFSDFELHLVNAEKSDFLYEVLVKGSVAAGTYKGTIVTESISPLKFIFN